jgi:hypothetical protein
MRSEEFGTMVNSFNVVYTASHCNKFCCLSVVLCDLLLQSLGVMLGSLSINEVKLQRC